MTKEKKGKHCFVIAPIGKEGSDIRKRSDSILKHIIRPVSISSGYMVQRADEISDPGLITTQVIRHLAEDDLVIADLTGHNPNVFYELAIRHSTRKPIVQMISTKDPLPFDIADSRTIRVDINDLDSVENCKQELAKQIQIAEKDEAVMENPISAAITLNLMSKSENMVEKSNAEILNILIELRSQIANLLRAQKAIGGGNVNTLRQDKPRSLGIPIFGMKCDNVTQWVISTKTRENPT